MTTVLAVIGGWFLLSLAVTAIYAALRRRARQRAEKEIIRRHIDGLVAAARDMPSIYDWRKEQLDARDVDLAFRKMWATEWPHDWERAIARGDA